MFFSCAQNTLQDSLLSPNKQLNKSEKDVSHIKYLLQLQCSKIKRLTGKLTNIKINTFLSNPVNLTRSYKEGKKACNKNNNVKRNTTPNSKSLERNFYVWTSPFLENEDTSKINTQQSPMS